MIPANACAHNVAEIITHPETGDPVLCRIPDALRKQLTPNAQQRSMSTTGCEIRFRLAGDKATIRFRACEVLGPPRLAQVLFGDFSHTYISVDTSEVVYELEKPDFDLLERAASSRIFHPRLVRLLLPTHAAVTGISIDGPLLPPEPGDVPSKRLLIYGSSITQGSGSMSGRESWAGRCAHLLAMDLINLGFGGGCHCEPEMADYLAGRTDWDMAILETGVNMLGLDPGEADRRIIHLIKTVSGAHPEKPVFCVGVFPCGEDVRRHFAGRAREIHELVRQTVKEINCPGLHFIDGERMLNHSRGMTTDLTHPSPAGMIEIGERIASKISSNF